MDVVEISGSLEPGFSKLNQRLERFPITALVHEPAWRFWSKIGHAAHDYGWKRRRPEHQSPAQARVTFSFDAVEGHRGHKAKHDTEGCPHLPLCTKSSSDLRGRAFGGISRRSRRFCTYGETHDEARPEELPLVECCSLPDTRGDCDEARDENRTSTTGPSVQKWRGPASDDETTKVWCTLSDTYVNMTFCLVMFDKRRYRITYVDQALFPFIGDVEIFKVESLQSLACGFGD